MGHPAVNLDDLSPEEQLELLEELDRRLDELEEDIRAGRPLGRPWSVVREQLRSK